MKRGPTPSAAMVAAKIIKAGAGGLSDADCQKIYNEFDPPIKPGTYSSVSKARRDGDPDLKNSQSEHGVANSNVQGARGDNSTNVSGASGYTEGGAPAFNVYDDQSAGTEHKFLTDAARDFGQSMGNKPFTLEDNLDHMQEKWEEMLESDDMQRSKKGGKRSRIKGNKTKAEKKALAKAAAICLRQHHDKTFAAMPKGPKPDTKLRNGMSSAGSKPKRKAKKRGGRA